MSYTGTILLLLGLIGAPQVSAPHHIAGERPVMYHVAAGTAGNLPVMPETAVKVTSINKEVVVNGSLADVWTAWTTTEGVTTFFAPQAKIELRAGGAYELYFMPDAPEGSRGSEGCTVIGFKPRKSLSFTWNAPPKFTEVRGKHTRVDIRFQRVDDTHTRVTLTHSGWKKGKQWSEVRNYFDNAWGWVMESLQQRFASGPVDWTAGGE